MSDLDESKIRELLKKSPALTPPESFYRGVMEKIERPRTPWYWGIPAKGLAAACVLLVTVLVTRETHKTQPELFQPRLDSADKLSINKNEPLREEKASNLKSLADTPEVQNRLNRSITGLAGKPTFAEEQDEVESKDQQFEARAKTASKHANPWPMQARDTGGVASQGSFMRSNGALEKKQIPVSAPSPALAKEKSALGYVSSGARKSDTVQWRGENSGVAVFRTVIVRSSEEWQRLWREHIGPQAAELPCPVIDFDRFLIVAVFSGTRPTAGYSVGITAVQTRADKVAILYHEIPPPPGMAVEILTAPYHIQVIPKTPLPVVFEKQP